MDSRERSWKPNQSRIQVKPSLLVLLLLPVLLHSRCVDDVKGLSNERIDFPGGGGPVDLSSSLSDSDCSEDEDVSGNETGQEITDGGGSITRRIRVRAQKVMAVMRDALKGVPDQIRQLPLLLGYFPGLKRTQEEIEHPFPCYVSEDTKSRATPTSVHRLRPSDIKVVAALGDSISSANGAMATSEDGIGVNFKGVSATGGGQGSWRQFLTLANILKVFNPSIKGYATGTPKTRQDPVAGLNLAQNGALDEEVIHQAKLLVRKLKSDPRIDFRRDWKLVNLLVGGNDICNEYCFVDNDKDSPQGHKRELEAVLDFLRVNLPRTFVNLIHVPNIIDLKNMNNLPFRCYIRRMIVCSCLFGGSDKGKADSVAKMVQGYWEAERQVASQPRFETDQFAVILQPFFVGVQPPPTVETRFGTSPDLSYFAPDCFHFSQKGNAHLANALWNNMLEPVGNKTIPIERPLMSVFHCPTKEAPYIFTRKNSLQYQRTGHQ